MKNPTKFSTIFFNDYIPFLKKSLQKSRGILNEHLKGHFRLHFWTIGGGPSPASQLASQPGPAGQASCRLACGLAGPARDGHWLAGLAGQAGWTGRRGGQPNWPELSSRKIATTAPPSWPNWPMVGRLPDSWGGSCIPFSCWLIVRCPIYQTGW